MTSNVKAMDDLRYPLGPAEPAATLAAAQRLHAIDQLGRLPAELEAAIAGLTAPQLETPYRDGAWTVRQLTHHLADSHLNAYVRFRLALTEGPEPAVRTYEQDRWAELHDARTAPPAVSLALLAAMHERWVLLLRSLAPSEFGRTVRHPDHGVLSVDWLLSYYSWHGRHHVAHITGLRRRNGWH